jgi:hypothetical protein
LTDPVRRSITVPLPADQARDLFTRRLPDWWPGALPRTDTGPAVQITPPGAPAPATVTFTPVDGGTRVDVEQPLVTPANSPDVPQAIAA